MVVSAESRRKMSVAAKNRKKRTPEQIETTRQRKSASLKLAWAKRSTEERKCTAKKTKETRELLRLDEQQGVRSKQYWDNLSADAREERAKKTSASWTDEKRAATGEQSKQRAAAMTAEEKLALGSAIREGQQKDPVRWAARNEHISKSHQAIADQTAVRQRDVAAARSDDQKEMNIENFKKGKLPEARARAVETRKPKTAEIYKKVGDAHKKQWAAMTSEEKSARVKKCITIQARDYTLINGETHKFHSSWEAEAANCLLRLGLKYRMQVWFDLVDCQYVADFVLDDLGIILEIKGHPKAWQRWNDVILPALTLHPLPYRVEVCGAYPTDTIISDLLRLSSNNTVDNQSCPC